MKLNKVHTMKPILFAKIPTPETIDFIRMWLGHEPEELKAFFVYGWIEDGRYSEFMDKESFHNKYVWRDSFPDGTGIIERRVVEVDS